MQQQFKIISMKNKCVNKKSQKYQGYEHPLVRSIQCIMEDHSKIIPTYQPFIPSHQNRTSSKLMRFSTLSPTANTEILVCLQPFHHIVHELPLLQPYLQCSSCFCAINPLTEISNYTSCRCNLCGQLMELPSLTSEQYKKSYAYQLNDINSFKNSQDSQSVNDKTNQTSMSQARQVCMVIQASEYNFEFGVHTSIINCIKALEDTDIEVGFIFFNERAVIFVDQNNLEIVNVPIIAEDNNPLEGWQALPIENSNFFQHISNFKPEMKDLIHSIMYESFYLKKTLLPQVIKMLSKFFKNTVQFKYFISTLNKIESKKQNKTGLISKIFNENQNILSSVINKKSVKLIPYQAVKDQSNIQTQIQIHENMQFFIIAQNASDQQCIDALRYMVYKIYSLKDKHNITELLYYDLYQNLGYCFYFNTSIFIKTSVELQLNLDKNNGSCLYENIQLLDSNQNKNWNHYEIIIRQANHATMIPLCFKVKPLTSKSTPFIQVSYHFRSNNNRTNIILNASLKQIIPQGQLGVQWIDDEVLFNYHLRKSISVWDGGQFSKLKELLQAQYSQLIQLFVQNYRNNSINFPKTLKHYFLFVYIWQKNINSGCINSYEIYKLLCSNLQTFGKQFYPRVYKLQENLKNIKCNKTIFENYNVIFMENGEQLYMIFNDTPVQEIISIFGKFDPIDILGKQHYQLPDLPSNVAQRQAIVAIRNSHQSNFLPLKIIDKSSHVFDCMITPYLYQKEDHLAFLRKAWKNA